MQGNKQLTVNQEKLVTLKNMLEKAKSSFAAVLPKHVTPERLIKIALSATSRNPLLLQCDAKSIIKAVMAASQLGLEPDSTLGLCYLVPFWNSKINAYEAQFQVGYRGLIDLARRSGNISTIESHVVHKGDKFKCAFGLEPVLKHTPNFEGGMHKEEDILCVYAVARFKDGSYQYEVMTKPQVDVFKNIKSKSKNKQGEITGPWTTDYEEMARKTVIKRLCKYLPLSVELATAVSLENVADQGESQIDYIEGEFEMPSQAIDGETGEIKNLNGNATKSDQLLDQLNRTEQQGDLVGNN